MDVKRGAAVVARLRGHDEEIHTLAWCPVPGEAFRPPRESQDITDLETFGVGQYSSGLFDNSKIIHCLL